MCILFPFLWSLRGAQRGQVIYLLFIFPRIFYFSSLFLFSLAFLIPHVGIKNGGTISGKPGKKIFYITVCIGEKRGPVAIVFILVFLFAFLLTNLTKMQTQDIYQLSASFHLISR